MVSAYYTSLSRLTSHLVLYELPLVFVLGLVGNIINIILFSRRTLRKNVGCMYFRCLSAANLFFWLSHALPRMFAARLNFETSQQNDA